MAAMAAILVSRHVRAQKANGHALRHGRGSCRTYWLEDDLNSQLHVEGLAGSDSGSTVEVPDGVVHQANPLKFVSVTGRHLPPLRAVPPQPPVGTDPGPEARLTRLKRLNISARSCTFSRSRIGTSFKIEKSTLPYPGPWNLLRDTLPKSST